MNVLYFHCFWCIIGGLIGMLLLLKEKNNLEILHFDDHSAAISACISYWERNNGNSWIIFLPLICIKNYNLWQKVLTLNDILKYMWFYIQISTAHKNNYNFSFLRWQSVEILAVKIQIQNLFFCLKQNRFSANYV